MQQSTGVITVCTEVSKRELSPPKGCGSVHSLSFEEKQ